MSSSNDPQSATAIEPAATEPEAVRLNLDVKVDAKSACERRITVTISREDIDRYLNNAVSELVPKAAVPGFRTGRAPRKLVETRFRKDVVDQVKGSLIMDSLEQVSTEQSLAPISEPDFDPASIVVPEEGPMTFEFEVEVRPEFDLPEWKGLKVERPVKTFTDADVDEQLQRLLANRGSLVPSDAPAAADDYLVCNIRFVHDGQELSAYPEELLRLREKLSLQDGTIEDFGKLLTGAKVGETRQGKLKLTDDAPQENLRGQEVTAEFTVQEIKKLQLPQVTPELLESLGDFESEDQLRTAIRDRLERQLSYHQQQRTREQVMDLLTVSANWDLPPALLKRQSSRELQRAILELRRNGFSEEEIRAHSNTLSQNSSAATAKALKQHFILERIAEDEKIEDLAADYDQEIMLIAMQSGESPRRVRAQLEKRGLMDTLRNQIIERKVIELILSHAKFDDQPFKEERNDTEALGLAACGAEPEIPSAAPDASASAPPTGK